jgi:hypothetical protein
MRLGKHEVAATVFLLAGTVGVFAWGRSVVQEEPAIRALRARLEATWVATSVQTAHARLEGPEAERTRLVFQGKTVAFEGMVDAGEGRGTSYIVEQRNRPTSIDLKLDKGWATGIFAIEGDRLTLTLNPLALPERFGVPTRPRPDAFGPDEGRLRYEFRRESR